MQKYPMWIRLIYKEFGNPIGYTGCVHSRTDFISLLIRLEVDKSDLTYLEFGEVEQSQDIVNALFENVQKTREKEGSELKQGKKPTNKQRELIKAAGLKADNWLVSKNLQHELHIVNRQSGNAKVIHV